MPPVLSRFNWINWQLTRLHYVKGYRYCLQGDRVLGLDQYLSLRIESNRVSFSGSADYYRGLRPETCARPDVPFVQWKWLDGTLHLSNDRYGFFPIFYTILKHGLDQEFLLSPSLLTLLRKGACRDLDWRAMSAFFRLDYYLGDDTPFLQIHSCPN